MGEMNCDILNEGIPLCNKKERTTETRNMNDSKTGWVKEILHKMVLTVWLHLTEVLE